MAIDDEQWEGGLIEAFGREKDGVGSLFAGAWIGTLLFFTLSEAQMGHFYGIIQVPFAGLAGLGV